MPIAAVVVTVLAGAARADDIQGKLGYCQDCHGPSGQGYRGYFPIPRIAGQPTRYFENQLRAFIGRRRENNIAVVMNKVHGISPSMQTALAAHFASLNPRPIGGAPRNLVETGRRIFQDGMPDANIAACAACHGPEAQGHEDIPRLAGQLYPYTVKELVNWATERGQQPSSEDTSKIMAPISHSLNKSQIEAVAAYLSDLK